MQLKNKVVLITGAAVRIGRGLAEALARQGCRLVLHCNRSSAEAGALAQRLRRHGTKVGIIKRDLLEPQAGEDVVRQAVKIFGRLDALINNAAVFSKERIMSLSEEQFRRQFDLNLIVPVLMTRAFAKAARKGKIINILDRRITAVEQNISAYLLSKKALAAFTKIAALELAPDIAVNGVAPGPILRSADGRIRDKAGKIPLGKRPATADVAEAVVFLLKSESITGQIIFVDGGQHLLG